MPFCLPASQPGSVDRPTRPLCAPLAAGQLVPGSSGDKLGYVRIATFSRQTTEKVREALATLKEQVLPAPLRSRGGLVLSRAAPVPYQMCLSCFLGPLILLHLCLAALA